MALNTTGQTSGSAVAAAGVVSAAADRQSSHIDWAALFAGAFVATAIAYVLTTFGSAVGLSMTSPYPERGAATPILLVAVGLWVVWVSASSYMAGGYVAGRMRRRLFDATEHEVDVRDAIHGVVVWAVASLFGAVLIGMTAAGAAKTGVQAAATAVSGAAQGAALGAGATAGTAAGQEGQAADPLRTIVDRMMRQVGASGGDPSVAAENAGEVGRIVRNGLAQGDIPEEDRAYLAQVVARSTGLSEPDARQRVDQGIEQAQAAAQKARDAADKARKAAIIAAFVLAASLAIGLAAAMWGAGIGGRHRDQGTIVAGWFPAR
jgi:hypothetical protein